jgi:hypothetical protein
MRLCPYSLDDHSPRGYIDVTRNALMPQKARAKPVSLPAAKTPLTLFEALSQAVEQAISVPGKVLQSLRSVRLRLIGGNGSSAKAHGAVTSGQSPGRAAGS